MTHKLILPNGAAMLLTNILSQPGWADTIGDIHQGGALLLDVLKLDKPKDADDAWYEAVREWELTERQRETCKKAIKSLAAKMQVPIGAPSYHLIKAFGLDE